MNNFVVTKFSIKTVVCFQLDIGNSLLKIIVKKNNYLTLNILFSIDYANPELNERQL